MFAFQTILFNCWFVFYIRRFIYKFVNVCPFEYTAVAGSGKVGSVTQVNHTSWMLIGTPTDRPKSVRNHCLIENFCGVFCVVTLPFWHLCWCMGFCHRTEYDLFHFSEMIHAPFFSKVPYWTFFPVTLNFLGCIHNTFCVELDDWVPYSEKTKVGWSSSLHLTVLICSQSLCSRYWDGAFVYHLKLFEIFILWVYYTIPFGFSLFRQFLIITFQLFKFHCLAKDHWRGFSTRNAHMVHNVN